MYLSSNTNIDGEIKVEYREDTKNYVIHLGLHGLMIVRQHEIEEIYNEVLGAMMHRRFAEDAIEVVEKSWEN